MEAALLDRSSPAPSAWAKGPVARAALPESSSVQGEGALPFAVYNRAPDFSKLPCVIIPAGQVVLHSGQGPVICLMTDILQYLVYQTRYRTFGSRVHIGSCRVSIINRRRATQTKHKSLKTVPAACWLLCLSLSARSSTGTSGPCPGVLADFVNYFGCFKGGWKDGSGTVEWYRSSYAIEFEN